MEPVGHKRFDPLGAAQLLLEIAHEHSLEPILRKIENCVNNRFMPASSCDTFGYNSL